MQQPLIPREVWPDLKAVNACSICTSFPVGLKVVREKEYWLSPMVYCLKTQRGKTENASVWERNAGIFTWGFNVAFLVGEEGVFLRGLLQWSIMGFYEGRWVLFTLSSMKARTQFCF